MDGDDDGAEYAAARLLSDAVDTIHCHTVHSFECGFKLTLTERQLIAADDAQRDAQREHKSGALPTAQCTRSDHDHERAATALHRTKSLDDLTATTSLAASHDVDVDAVSASMSADDGGSASTSGSGPARWRKAEFAFVSLRSVLRAKRRAFRAVCGGSERAMESKFVTKIKRPLLVERCNGSGRVDGEGARNEKESVSFTLFYAFSYWKEHKSKTDADPRNPGLRFCDVYVAPKYLSLKDEVLHHGFCSNATCHAAARRTECLLLDI